MIGTIGDNTINVPAGYPDAMRLAAYRAQDIGKQIMLLSYNFGIGNIYVVPLDFCRLRIGHVFVRHDEVCAFVGADLVGCIASIDTTGEFKFGTPGVFAAD